MPYSCHLCTIYMIVCSCHQFCLCCSFSSCHWYSALQPPVQYDCAQCGAFLFILSSAGQPRTDIHINIPAVAFPHFCCLCLVVHGYRQKNSERAGDSWILSRFWDKWYHSGVDSDWWGSWLWNVSRGGTLQRPGPWQHLNLQLLLPYLLGLLCIVCETSAVELCRFPHFDLFFGGIVC